MMGMINPVLGMAKPRAPLA